MSACVYVGVYAQVHVQYMYIYIHIHTERISQSHPLKAQFHAVSPPVWHQTF